MKTVLFLPLLLISALTALAQPTVGLISRTPASEDGYILFPPMFSHNTYLIDKCGREVHKWQSSYDPGMSAYLLPDGTLLRPGKVNNPVFFYGGSGGVIKQWDWNNNLIWSYRISSNTQCQHHDVCYLPNGNILTIVWDSKTKVEAIGAGRNPTSVGQSLWPDKIVELEPSGFNSANIVWEWHAWDHLVQDYDSSLPYYGVIADHPERININQYEGQTPDPDWLHINSVAYNKDLDQIILSSYYFNELWIIDHSTTSQEAKGTNGGRSGKGGDLLYRWGNPMAYGRGNPLQRKFFAQHDIHWIPDGFPDAGKIILYNNGYGRPGGDYSTVEVLDPPVDPLGNYHLVPGGPYLPFVPSWVYQNPIPPLFYSEVISGATRLTNGNTLICEGTKGNLFEVDNGGNIVWNYINPVGNTGATVQGKIPMENYVFRIRQYPLSYTGFAGHVLKPKLPIEINPLAYVCGTPTGIAQSYHPGAEFEAVNPMGNNINLRSEKGGSDVQIKLLNGMGSLCGQWRSDLEAGKWLELRTARDLPAGLYFLRIISGNLESKLRLIKE